MTDREIDRQLVARAQRGDKQAFELLVEKYQRKLARLLSRFIRDPAEVEDVTQEAFIKAYRALPAFRGDSAFYTWLYRIGINTAKNYLRAMGRRAPTHGHEVVLGRVDADPVQPRIESAVATECGEGPVGLDERLLRHVLDLCRVSDKT